jgi:membrane associated rhomboid family serine protease
MADEKVSFRKSLSIVFALVSVLWVVQFLQYFGLYNFTGFANHPRHLDGLKGIIFSPFIHDAYSLDHIISNTLPILVLLTVLINAYPRVAFIALVFIHLTSGLLVWLFAPSATYHIGISGIIYGIAAFLVASGIFRKDRTSITISILVVLIYGGMIGGILPAKGISWQSLLFCAKMIYLRRIRLKQKCSRKKNIFLMMIPAYKH